LFKKTNANSTACVTSNFLHELNISAESIAPLTIHLSYESFVSTISYQAYHYMADQQCYSLSSTLGGPECLLIGEGDAIPDWKDNLFFAGPAEPPFSGVSVPFFNAEP
jgi:hypothetical protein